MRDFCKAEENMTEISAGRGPPSKPVGPAAYDASRCAVKVEIRHDARSGKFVMSMAADSGRLGSINPQHTERRRRQEKT